MYIILLIWVFLSIPLSCAIIIGGPDNDDFDDGPIVAH